MLALLAERSAEPFPIFLADVRGTVEVALRRFLRQRAEEARAHGPAAGLLVQAIADLTLRGGKRLRPALLAAAYEACGGRGGPPAVAMVGVALELLQSYLLIHDDWMDGDETRRGGPSAHVFLARELGDARGGEAAAILAGDLACALAQEALLAAPFPAAELGRAARALARIQKEVIAGQVLDVTLATTDADALARLHDLKTGSYTVRGPIGLGAGLAGASPEQEEGLRRYAEPLGRAFQLRDDLLGLLGAPELTGKPRGDLAQGKRTAIVIELEADPRGRRLLDGVLGSPDADGAAVAALQAHVETSGIAARMEARIDGLLALALGVLAEAPLTRHGKALLVEAAFALARRVR